MRWTSQIPARRANQRHHSCRPPCGLSCREGEQLFKTHCRMEVATPSRPARMSQCSSHDYAGKIWRRAGRARSSKQSSGHASRDLGQQLKPQPCWPTGREAWPQVQQTRWIVQSTRRLVWDRTGNAALGGLGITKVSVRENLGISKKLAAVESSAG